MSPMPVCAEWTADFFWSMEINTCWQSPPGKPLCKYLNELVRVLQKGNHRPRKQVGCPYTPAAEVFHVQISSSGLHVSRFNCSSAWKSCHKHYLEGLRHRKPKNTKWIVMCLPHQLQCIVLKVRLHTITWVVVVVVWAHFQPQLWFFVYAQPLLYL